MLNGRFIRKKGKGIKIKILLTLLSMVLLWSLILLILSTWIIMIARLKMLNKIFNKIHNAFSI